ncbi:MAG: gliding motility-associated C-terminal domain-containing protein [Bacteroidota bacterium]
MTLCIAQSTELCANGLDDDQDGLIDIQDPDCSCSLNLPPSPIVNPSFEHHSCCPDAQAQLNCAEGWEDASEPTPDYFHMCGWQEFPSYQVPLPMPDGEACVGFRNGQFEGAVMETSWKEYVGTCLSYPLKEGERYLFEMYIGFGDERHSPPNEFTFWGIESCDDLPFGNGDPSFGCPAAITAYHRLGHTWLEGDQEWKRVLFEVIPEVEINAIAIGPGCLDSMAKPNPYYFLDNIRLLEKSDYEGDIRLLNEPCSPEERLLVKGDSDFFFQIGNRLQWYKDGVAIPGETGAILVRMYGNGSYQVRIEAMDGECVLSQPFEYVRPESYTELQFAICEGGSYQLGEEVLTEEGVYLDTLQTITGCDSIVLLDLSVESEFLDSIHTRIFPSESYQIGSRRFDAPGEYEVLLESTGGCDSIIYLSLSYYEIFAPSAFSPNGDGINDYFSLTGGEEVIEISQLKIFNRWGNLVYQVEGLSPGAMDDGWDGMAKGRPLPEGVYVYVASVLFDDGKSRRSAGSIVLMK